MISYDICAEAFQVRKKHNVIPSHCHSGYKAGQAGSRGLRSLWTVRRSGRSFFLPEQLLHTNENIMSLSVTGMRKKAVI